MLRYGPLGQERPAVLLGDDQALDLRDHVRDLDPGFFADDGLIQVRAMVDAGQLSRVDLRGQRIGAPVARPSQVLCIGLNFADHAAESGLEPPDEPMVFNKAPNALVGPYDDVLLPPGSQKSDWEVELAVVIGRRARYWQERTRRRRTSPVMRSPTTSANGSSNSNVLANGQGEVLRDVQPDGTVARDRGRDR